MGRIFPWLRVNRSGCWRPSSPVHIGHEKCVDDGRNSPRPSVNMLGSWRPFSLTGTEEGKIEAKLPSALC